MDFVNKLGHLIPIKELIILIASLQWILGASISYQISVQHYRYYMYVDESTYMSYIVPSLILLWLGFQLVNVKLIKQKIVDLFAEEKDTLKKHGFVFVTIGLISRIVVSLISIPSLSFVLYLLNLVLIIGVVYLFFCYPNRKWSLFLLTITSFFISAIYSGLFHGFLLIAIFLTFFVISEKMKFVSKMFMLVISFGVVFTIQTVKTELRSEVWVSSNKKDALSVFWNLVQSQFFQESTTKSSLNYESEKLNETNEVNSRLNQGWIISKIMSNIPYKEDYLGGETVREAFSSSLLPRFLFPDKKGAADGIEDFKRITGLDLQRGTSMGLSITGEFYANYGIYGGWLAIFIYGLLISLFIKWFINFSGHKSPLTYIWLVLIFYQVVKAETELIKILNHMFKSLIIFYIFKLIANSFQFKFLIKGDK
ncbi:hypothetical protein [Acidiluteibacter ferrifornacis]|uniref:Oligosaccharide repeat unit polymerase n=1 Tax=Acidiluteibacter ferrifornacis TaxID=2692424 RepID=A0A6N9NL91_9FLAO|nr:hypothetical protein [Acidiluteibacter ferrifornacis]NBG66654.1 hypothetical protein [Acidiluteibacter ferrifornacis]